MSPFPRLRELFVNPATPVLTLVAIGGSVGTLVGFLLAWALP